MSIKRPNIDEAANKLFVEAAWHMKGIALELLGRFEDAAKSYSEAIKLRTAGKEGAAATALGTVADLILLERSKSHV